MKRILALLLACAAVFSLSACAAGGDDAVVRMSLEELLTFANENLENTNPALMGELLLDGEHTYGTIEHKTYYSKTLKRERNYNIMFPPNYDENQKYPVLYALHGYWGDEYSLLDQGDGTIKCRELIGNLIYEGKAVPMIIVFPDIFCHETKEDCDGMNDENNKAYDNFINELKNDLMPHIEKTYPVLKGRENTAITGFSMGGREALAIGLQLSDKIGYIGAACPAPGVVPDCISEDAKMVFPKGKEPYILMISAGTDDTVVYGTPEGYHNVFTNNDVPHIWHLVSGGGHWGSTIRPHLYNFLQYCFKEPEGAEAEE